jgi:hypothetical protein
LWRKCSGIKQNRMNLLSKTKFWTNENHWEWATKPNPREKASFLSENILPMQESGQLNFIKDLG